MILFELENAKEFILYLQQFYMKSTIIFSIALGNATFGNASLAFIEPYQSYIEVPLPFYLSIIAALNATFSTKVNEFDFRMSRKPKPMFRMLNTKCCAPATILTLSST